MGFMQFSEKDLLRNTVVEPGWYQVHIDAAGEEQTASNGKSINYLMEGTIIKSAEDGSEKFAKVPLTWNFNSKAQGFAIDYFKALGIDTIDTNERYQLEFGVGKVIEIFVENQDYQGRTMNRVNHKYRKLSQ